MAAPAGAPAATPSSLRVRVALAAGLIAVVAALSASLAVLWVAERAMADRAERYASALSTATASALSALVIPQNPESASVRGQRAVEHDRFLREARTLLSALVPSTARHAALVDAGEGQSRVGGQLVAVAEQEVPALSDDEQATLRLVAVGGPGLVRRRADGSVLALAPVRAGAGGTRLAAVLLLTVDAVPRLGGPAAFFRLTRLRSLVGLIALADGVVVLLLGALVLTRLVVEPLSALDRAAQRIAEGDLSASVSIDARSRG
jgi:HAMP domain-containing protein